MPQGAGAAGTFVVSINYAGNTIVNGLAAGASITIPVHQSCSDGQVHSATVDSANQIPESDEPDNVTTIGPVFC